MNDASTALRGWGSTESDIIRSIEASGRHGRTIDELRNTITSVRRMTPGQRHATLARIVANTSIVRVAGPQGGITYVYARFADQVHAPPPPPDPIEARRRERARWHRNNHPTQRRPA